MRTEHAAASDIEPFVPGFLDRLGDRVRLTDRKSAHVEALRLRPEITASPLFEPAVRRRADQLSTFLHPHCARTRQIGRLPAPDGRLVIVSDAVDGWRLSEVLEAADQCGAAFHADAVLFLLRQLLDAVASLHEVAAGVSHGALGPERLVVTADGRLVVTESVLGGALRYLPPMPPDRLWRDLRLAVADGEAQPFGRLTDLRQVGIVALSLALGRQLRRDEYPTRLPSLLRESAPARPGLGADGLGPAVREWLVRVLSLTDDLTPWSVAEARRELNRIVESDARHAFAPTGVAGMLRTVGDYLAAAPDVPVPIAVPSAPRDTKTGPVLVRPPEPPARQDQAVATAAEPAVQPPAPEPHDAAPYPVAPIVCGVEPVAVAPLVCDAPPPVNDVPTPAIEEPQPVPDDSWPEPAVRPVVDQLVESTEKTFVEARLAPTPVEPPPSTGVAESTSRPQVAANQLHPSPSPLESVALAPKPARERAAQGAAAGDSGSPHAHVPVSASASRPLFGVHLAEETSEPAAPPSGRRTLTLVGIGAAALVILALGGYMGLRPSAVTATATLRGASAPSSAVPDASRTVAAPPSAAAPGPDAQRGPTPPRTPEATPPAAAPAPPAPTGTIEVVSPVPLTISEGGRALGASGEPIQVPAGRHTLELAREDLGYQAVQVVDVRPGRPQRIEPTLPSGVANLNATPWAEVWIDGRKVGETPLGHVPLTIGSHEVQFRHPELGNQTRTLVVTTSAVARLSVELKK